MNDCFRLIRHSDRAWHDRFFGFVASIFEGGRTFSAWGARGGWVDGYDVFAVVVDDQVVSTVGRQSMRYMINGEARSGYQIGAVATHADHRNRGLARLLMNKVLDELDAPDQPVILFANSSVLDFYPRFGFRRLAQTGFIGHTDVRPYPSNNGYTNWELSADRANAARRALVAGGLPDEKISRVVGLSSSVLFNKAEPQSPINRRISIVVMTRQAEAAALKTDVASDTPTTTPAAGPAAADQPASGSTASTESAPSPSAAANAAVAAAANSPLSSYAPAR